MVGYNGVEPLFERYQHPVLDRWTNILYSYICSLIANFAHRRALLRLRLLYPLLLRMSAEQQQQ